MIPMGSGMGGMNSGSLGGGGGMYGTPTGRLGGAAGADGLGGAGVMQHRQQQHHQMQSPSLLGGASPAQRFVFAVFFGVSLVFLMMTSDILRSLDP